MPCLLVNVRKLEFGDLFTYASNHMVNATVCESDTQNQTRLFQQNSCIFPRSVKCSSSYSLHKFGDPAPPRFHIPETMFFRFQIAFKYTHKPTKVHTFGLFFTLLDPGNHAPSCAPLEERAQPMAVWQMLRACICH